jgi:hypothetical protein
MALRPGRRASREPDPGSSRRWRRVILGVVVGLALIAIGRSSGVWWVSSDHPRRLEAVDDTAVELARLAPRGRRLLLVMIDGLGVRPFERALSTGAMPRLERLLSERSTSRTEALSSFPSATAPALPELLTGRYADLEEVETPGAVHAFDREQRRIIRYITEPDAWRWPVPNLFDAAEAAGLSTVTVFEGRWEGPESILTTAAIAGAAVREVIGAGARGSGDRGPVRAFLERLQRKGMPDIALLVFNDVDLKGHFHGPDSGEVQAALRETDALLGEVLDWLAHAPDTDGTPLLQRTTLVLFADHGMVRSGRFLDLETFFQERGLSAYDASTLTQVVLRERLGTLWTQWPDVILVSGGSNVTQVYLRHPSGGWLEGQIPPDEGRTSRRPDAAEVARSLAEHPGVEHVLRSIDADTIEVLASGERRARILQRRTEAGRSYAYAVSQEATGDPLDYLADPRTAWLVCRSARPKQACFRDPTTWMRETHHSRFPGAVPLIPKAFHPQRFTGDLMLTSLPGWSFLRWQKGDHGNLERDAMLVPLVLNGPGIEAARLPHLVRLVDLFPTLAVLLGADAEDPALREIDGRALPGVRSP